MSFLAKIEKSILKFIWMHKRPQVVKEILSKKENH
jgi:predicted transcriptional regulator